VLQLSSSLTENSNLCHRSAEDVYSFTVSFCNISTFGLFAEKVFASVVPKCVAENCNGVVKPGETIYYSCYC